MIPAGVKGAGHRANVVPVTESADRILKAVERETLRCDASYKIVTLGVTAHYKRNAVVAAVRWFVKSAWRASACARSRARVPSGSAVGCCRTG